jgi:hypothetical protein
MGNLSNIRTIQNGGRITTPTFNLALWEYAYVLELKRYWPWVEKKARRLKELKEIDLFGLSEKEAKKKLWQINYLEQELSDMVGFKEFTDNLKIAYLETSVWLSEYFEKREQKNFEQMVNLKKDFQSIFEAYHHSSRNEKKLSELVIQFFEETESKGLVLDCLKNAESWI